MLVADALYAVILRYINIVLKNNFIILVLW